MLESVSVTPLLDAVLALVADVVAAALVSDEVPLFCNVAIREEKFCFTSARVVGVDAAMLAATASVELVAAVVPEVCCDAYDCRSVSSCSATSAVVLDVEPEVPALSGGGPGGGPPCGPAMPCSAAVVLSAGLAASVEDAVAASVALVASSEDVLAALPLLA